MPAHNRIDLIEFPASDAAALDAARSFYEAAFGWTFTAYGETYVDTADSGVSAGINATDSSLRQKMPLAVVYVDDLEVARRSVIEAGGVILQDVYAFPGGRRFHFVDPAGNGLGVWSE